MASAAGYLAVSNDFGSVRVTKAGRQYVKDLVNEQSAGCDRVTDIRADWLGFHIAVESDCTPEEAEARLIPPPTTAVDSLVVAEPPVQEPAVTAVSAATADYNCLLAVLGLLAAAIGVLVFILAPPLGLLFWLAYGGVLGGTLLATIYFVNDCRQVLEVDQQARYGGVVYRYNCNFSYNSDWRWNGVQWVPVYERWTC